MIAVARENARRFGREGAVAFETGDVLDDATFRDAKYDLVTFTHAAHHLPDLASVRRVLTTMDRLAHTDGVVAVVDLVRLRGPVVTEEYVNWAGKDYVARGLDAFLMDFRNSMYAAWTEDELASAVPKSEHRSWVQLVPRGMPVLQILLGLPAAQNRVFLRKGPPWNEVDHPVPADMRFEHRMLRWSLFHFGQFRWLHRP
jgi:hypothetical protein